MRAVLRLREPMITICLKVVSCPDFVSFGQARPSPGTRPAGPNAKEPARWGRLFICAMSAVSKINKANANRRGQQLLLSHHEAHRLGGFPGRYRGHVQARFQAGRQGNNLWAGHQFLAGGYRGH